MKLSDIRKSLATKHPIKGNSMIQQLNISWNNDDTLFGVVREASAQEYISFKMVDKNSVDAIRDIKYVINEMSDDLLYFTAYYKGITCRRMSLILNINENQRAYLVMQNPDELINSNASLEPYDRLILKEIDLNEKKPNDKNIVLSAEFNLPREIWDIHAEYILNNFIQEEEHREQKIISKYEEQTYLNKILETGSLPIYQKEIVQNNNIDRYKVEYIANHVQSIIDMGIYSSIDELPDEYKNPHILAKLNF